jgi:hypothetical protein
MDDDFDMRTISLGAGVQSSAIYRMAVMGEIGPRPDYAIFADTQNEPPWVMESLESLRKWGDIPIVIATKGELGDDIRKAVGLKEGHFANIPFWTRSKDNPELPTPLRRHCTSDFKIKVVHKKVRELLGLKPGQRASGKYRVEEWIGISVDEVMRAKPSRVDWIETRWPLLYDKPMRRFEIKAWLEANGFPIPGKSACVFCPYRRPIEYARWRDEEPEVFAQAVEWDEMLRSSESGLLKGMNDAAYIWKDLKPLRELPSVAELESRDDNQLDMFNDGCETGMCGV